MRLLKATVAFLSCLALTAAVPWESQSAARKVASIESGRLAPGAAIRFSPGELNAWMRDEARDRVPHCLRDLRLTLSPGRATASAMIDFVKLGQAATGEAPGWVMRNLFAGERPVVVTARLASRGGRARVDVERVEVSGVPVEGRMLDFLIDDYVRPTFPSTKISEWFEMGYSLDRVAIDSAGISATIGRR